MSAMEWSRLVRERLRAAAGAEPADDVVDELAEYLSERYEDRVASGVEPPTALAEAAEAEAPVVALAGPRSPRLGVRCPRQCSAAASSREAVRSAPPALFVR